jgi:adenosylmethionine-8-amino-7-oxononanoate aminotransferase
VQAELAERLAHLAPGDLEPGLLHDRRREAVESAWKAAKQYFKLVGKPLKHKVISRAWPTTAHRTAPGHHRAAEHEEGLRAAGARWLPGARTPTASATELADDPVAFGRWAADRIEEAILFEGADTVAAVFLEPVQNSGGCFTPPPGYFARVREICDRHDVLLSRTR